MPRKRYRIVIDTNLWISFLINQDFSRLDKIINNRKVQLLFSQELMNEFLNVTSRPKFRKYFDKEIVDDVLKDIAGFAKFILVTSEVSVCKDVKDNFLLALAKDGHATHLLTGDKVLLAIKKFGRTEITTMTDFLNAV